MRRHELDVLSLVAGLVFVVVAVSHLVTQATDADLDGRWIAPLVLIALGVAGLVGALRSGRRGELAAPEDGGDEALVGKG